MKRSSSDARSDGLKPYLSTWGAVALSFGCAVGWGAFIMPGTTFLPVAGPLGTLIGLGIGAAVMFLVGRNYHYLIQNFPEADGAYGYAKRVCGGDHGFICGWFLILTYIAIAWANATALALIGRHLLGGIFSFGFHYHVSGYEVYVGEIFLSIAALLLVGGAFLCGKRLAARLQTAFALVLCVGIAVFRSVFNRDRTGRLGTSTVAWLVLLFFIFFSSHMWNRQKAHGLTDVVVDEISRRYVPIDSDGNVTEEEKAADKFLKSQKEMIDDELTRYNLVQIALVLIALALMYSIYAVISRREKDAAKAKSYFFSTISHDIRTPLNAIVGFSQMLKLGVKTKEEQDEAVNSILIGSKSLLAFVNDILDLSRRGSDDAELSLIPTDCHALLRDVEEAFRVGIPKKGVEIRAAIGEMPQLFVDPLLLRHIVSNLVSNAVKFTETGHVEVRGRFVLDTGGDLADETGTLVVEVEDTGVGISEEDKAKIDSPYTQTESKIARNGGTGLSLAVCRQLAEEMGGAMSFESELGKGSTFRITIPKVKVVVTGNGERGTGNGETTETAGTTGSGDLTPVAPVAPVPLVTDVPSVPPVPVVQASTPRLLLVDDQKMNLTVLKAMIKRVGGFEIETAADGREALARLQDQNAPKVDAVLTDMWMPELDGEGLAKAIRADASLAGLPVHVITADVELQENYAEKGFDSIILKPVTVGTLGPLLAGLAERKG